MTGPLVWVWSIHVDAVYLRVDVEGHEADDAGHHKPKWQVVPEYVFCSVREHGGSST